MNSKSDLSGLLPSRKGSHTVGEEGSGEAGRQAGKGEAGDGCKNHTNQLGLRLQARWGD